MTLERSKSLNWRLTCKDKYHCSNEPFTVEDTVTCFTMKQLHQEKKKNIYLDYFPKFSIARCMDACKNTPLSASENVLGIITQTLSYTIQSKSTDDHCCKES